jgi:central glycolytic genes regulator
MKDMLDIQKQLIPDFIDSMKKRYHILHHIRMQGTIGRRALASSIDMTERVLRSEVNFLKEQGLIEIEVKGMHLTDSGKELLVNMDAMMKVINGFTELEEQICRTYQLTRVIIVPGDADRSIHAKKELGRAGAHELRKYLTQGQVIAVTGGSTMAEVANYLGSASNIKDCWFVPARGGLGERVELQANHIASTMAKRVGGQYRLMHVAEQLGEEVTQSLSQDPQIKEIIQFVRNAKIVIHGIGDAMVMASRRKVNSETKDMLVKQGALAEAFGYYFDQNGDVIHKTSNVGLRLEDLTQMDVVIGVAGGKSKAASIAAFLKHGIEDILIIDEAAAMEVLKQSSSSRS